MKDLDGPGPQEKGAKKDAMKGLGSPSLQEKGEWHTVKKGLDGPDLQEKGAKKASENKVHNMLQRAIKLVVTLGKAIIVRAVVILIRKALHHVFSGH